MAFVLRAWGILPPKEENYARQKQAVDAGDSDRISGYHTGDGSVDLKKRPAIKSGTGGWKACPFILGMEGCERLAYYGMSMNLVVYLKDILHQKSATASNNVTNWSGTCYITPLIGAFLADAFWGRYWTIATFSIIYVTGLILLTLSAALPTLKPPSCSGDGALCAKATSTQVGVFYFSLYVIALGTGGIKPCVSSFGADQFDDSEPDDRKKKASFFNWFYFSINVGALIASSVLVYTQENLSWAIGFGIPAAAMVTALVFFILGTPLYRHQRPGGSPLTRIAQVLVAAGRKWRVPSATKVLYEVTDKDSVIQGSRKLQHTYEYQFLDKAATVTAMDTGKIPTPWQLTTVTQVEEVKLILRILPIWAATIFFATVYSQMSTFFILQGERMDASMGPHFEVPAASLTVFDTLSVLFWVAVYDRIVVPAVRTYTGHERGFTQLQRMGIGLAISVLAMVAAALVEIERLKQARRYGLVDNDKDSVPLSIFWQIPQYFLIGAAEVFVFVGQIEFFYDQSPDAMRTLGSALNLTTVALGNYLSTLLVTIVTKITGNDPGWIPDNLNRGHVDYFFWLLAALSFINLIIYVVLAKRYKYKKIDNEIGDAQDTAATELHRLSDAPATLPGDMKKRVDDDLFELKRDDRQD